MSETTLASGGTISPFQAMYHELYSWMENVKFPAPNGSYAGYTGANFKLEIGANRNVLAFNVGAFGWGTGVTALDFGPLGSLMSDTGTVIFGGNTYYDGTNYKAKATGAAGRLYFNVGTLQYDYAASVSAGANQTYVPGWKVDASGNFLVGTTNVATINPGVILGPAGSMLIGNTAQASGWAFQQFLRSATPIGSVTQSGTTAVLFNTTSDLRLKKNIEYAPDAGAIIDSIKVRSFDWKSVDEHVSHGFIAQELHEVAPQAVKVGTEEDTDPWAVDPSKLVALLVKEVQSLRARLEAAGIA